MKRKFSLGKIVTEWVGGVGQHLAKKQVKKTAASKSSIQANKKVLMFGWELPPFNSGGLGVACFEMAQSMSKKKAEITFVLPKKHDINLPFMKVAFADSDTKKKHSWTTSLHSKKDKNFAVTEIDTMLFPYETDESYRQKMSQYSERYAKYGKGSYASQGLYSNDMIGEVYRYGDAAGEVAKKEKCDVIHAHDWLSFPAGVRAKQISHKPLVAHVHALEYDRSHEHSVDGRICRIEKAGLEAADRVIAVSEYTKQRIIKYYGISEAKIKVVHNGIKIDQNAATASEEISLKHLKANGRKIVLFVGRITYQKGVDYLITAAGKVAKLYPKAVFVIAGSGDMRNQIINQVANLGISDKVYFPGFMREKELEKIYRSADVYVMPSVSEPFGIVALEALANRVPVILSKQSGAVEVLNHALKVDFWDTDELANKIIAVLKYPNLQRTLSTHGHTEANKCTWDNAADKCLEIYNNLSVA
ncbi:MAG: glycosyltransferase family 4 protein [bacterium]